MDWGACIICQKVTVELVQASPTADGTAPYRTFLDHVNCFSTTHVRWEQGTGWLCSKQSSMAQVFSHKVFTRYTRLVPTTWREQKGRQILNKPDPYFWKIIKTLQRFPGTEPVSVQDGNLIFKLTDLHDLYESRLSSPLYKLNDTLLLKQSSQCLQFWKVNQNLAGLWPSVSGLHLQKMCWTHANPQSLLCKIYTQLLTVPGNLCNVFQK